MAKAGAGPAAPPPPPPVQAPPPPPPVQAPAPGQDAQRGAANALFSEINKAGTNIASGTCTDYFLLGVHRKVVLTTAHLSQVFSIVHYGYLNMHVHMNARSNHQHSKSVLLPTFPVGTSTSKLVDCTADS